MFSLSPLPSLHRLPPDGAPDPRPRSTRCSPSVSLPTSVEAPGRSLPGPPVQRPRRTSGSGSATRTGSAGRNRRARLCVRAAVRAHQADATGCPEAVQASGGSGAKECGADGGVFERRDQLHPSRAPGARQGVDPSRAAEEHRPRQATSTTRVKRPDERRRHRPVRPATRIGHKGGERAAAAPGAGGTGAGAPAMLPSRSTSIRSSANGGRVQ